LIYAIAFLSGAALMGLEMVGSRILAPTFGSSIFIWGSLIGVVLAALSLGYYAGGRLADRYPDPVPLSILLGLSGLWILAIPSMSGAVFQRLAGFTGARGPLLACLALFFVPSLLMAMVTPWCMRLTIKSVEGAGRSSGMLNAVSNLGSIAGTFATSFYLIPRIGTGAILRSIAAVLLFLGLVVAVLSRRRRIVTVAAALFIVGLAAYAGGRISGKSPEEKTPNPPGLSATGVIYQQQSLYHNIYVENNGNIRRLRFDNSVQGGMLIDCPFESAYPYPDYFHLALTLNPDIKDVLMIGLGAGLIPKRFHRDYPDMTVEVVEIDQAVLDVARTYFEFPDNDKIKAYIEDGRVYLRNTKKQYDLIMVDAYFAESIPFHLTTVEFYRAAEARLRPGGVLASNMIGALEGEKSALFRSMYATMSQVFPTPYVFDVHPNQPLDAYRNIVVFAELPDGAEDAGSEGLSAESDSRLTVGDFVAKASALADGGEVTIANFADIAFTLYDRPIDTEGAVILTDDHAPVDSLLHLY